MGAAPQLSTTAGCQATHQHILKRTVFSRTGRFFVISVTVRTAPSQQHGTRTYTRGRFTVREELVVCQQNAIQTAGELRECCCPLLHAAVLRLKQEALQQLLDQEEAERKAAEGLVLSAEGVDLGMEGQHSQGTEPRQQQQGQEQDQEHQKKQQKQPSWLKRLTHRPSLTACAPATQDGGISATVGCLQLGALGARIGSALRSLLKTAVRGAVFLRDAAPVGVVLAVGVLPEDNKTPDAGTAAEAAEATVEAVEQPLKFAADVRQGSVQIEVLCGLPTH